MGNSLNVLSTCLPQPPPHPGDEDNETIPNVLEQKKKLAPQASESEEEWDNFDKPNDTSQKRKEPEKVIVKQEQKPAPAANVATSSPAIVEKEVSKKTITSSKAAEESTSQKETDHEDDWDEFEDNFQEQPVSNTNTTTTNYAQPMPTIELPSYSTIEPVEEEDSQKSSTAPPKSLNLPKAKNLVNKNAPKTPSKETATPTPTADDLDFFSDMTVKYVPPAKLEKSGPASPLPKSTSSNQILSPRASSVPVEQIEAEKTARLGFEGNVAAQGAAWGDDSELDLDDN